MGRFPDWFRRKRASPPGMTIEELHVTEKHGIELRAKHPGVAIMAEEMARFFVDNKGVNFVTMAVWTEKLGYMNIEFRREGGKPLAKVLEELTAENTRLKEQSR